MPLNLDQFCILSVVYVDISEGSCVIFVALGDVFKLSFAGFKINNFKNSPKNCWLELKERYRFQNPLPFLH